METMMKGRTLEQISVGEKIKRADGTIWVCVEKPDPEIHPNKDRAISFCRKDDSGNIHLARYDPETELEKIRGPSGKDYKLMPGNPYHGRYNHLLRRAEV